MADKNYVYLFATGMVNPFLKKSRKAVEIITSQEGFMAIHPAAPHGMLWVFDSLNNAKGARNVAESKGIKCGRNIMRGWIDGDTLEVEDKADG